MSVILSFSAKKPNFDNQFFPAIFEKPCKLNEGCMDAKRYPASTPQYPASTPHYPAIVPLSKPAINQTILV